MKPNLFVRPELARAMHKIEGFAFSSIVYVTQLVNSFLYGIIIFKGLEENELSTSVLKDT